ncbi:hypothetical protein Pst134EA_030364 [Puccinia striiformis f. sp. tritici]|uniref:hypothetical protein n=1 Tax=Puccinia striiformis f. sp. tritici TaxID=168172 RepID=UPI00200821DC|nr:hypothetical protein Pst134EA_030364 [Puccinia striiformis f. sp. tritici]KAH9446445.1 hypothetical protein Pst134EA_030364 [Puccinia striiformis f. sp. tritici]KAI9599945.1 hypothetical protein KEM48_000056 [Puccinia striiformis f. sp. tritici PST-130]
MLSNRFILVALIAIISLILNVTSTAITPGETGLSSNAHPSGKPKKGTEPEDLRVYYTVIPKKNADEGLLEDLENELKTTKNVKIGISYPGDPRFVAKMLPEQANTLRHNELIQAVVEKKKGHQV